MRCCCRLSRIVTDTCRLRCHVATAGRVWCAVPRACTIRGVEPWNSSWMDRRKSPERIWVWVNTYRYIFSEMNIHKSQLFWGEQKVPGFWPIPICSRCFCQPKPWGFSWGYDGINPLDLQMYSLSWDKLLKWLGLSWDKLLKWLVYSGISY